MAGGPRTPEVPAPSIPIDLAVSAAKAAQAACAAFHFGFAVLDQSGLPKLIYITDGSAGSHATRATGKASAALLINGPSQGLTDAAAADPAIAAKVQAAKDAGHPLMAMAGGLPIVVGGKALGAIGVSGAEPGGHDPECAAAAMKVIEAQLK
jgi:glc operon protein GlcG